MESETMEILKSDYNFIARAYIRTPHYPDSPDNRSPVNGNGVYKIRCPDNEESE